MIGLLLYVFLTFATTIGLMTYFRLNGMVNGGEEAVILMLLAFLCGMFWPLTIPLAGVYKMSEWIAKALSE